MGTAAVQGELWGAKARDWAEAQEPAWRPVFEQVSKIAGVGPGKSYLDIGCGAGGALALARSLGSEVAGLDAAEALVLEARRRLPGARIEIGEMEELPFSDAMFDVVTGINAFQFAGDIGRALSEARRVCKPGGTVMMLVWGEREKCELQISTLGALAPLLPPSPAGPPSPQFAKPGVIEGMMEAAGLRVIDAGEFEAPLIYGDEATALRAVSSAGIATRAERNAGAEAVSKALAAALAPYVAGDGKVVLSNRFRWVKSTA
jgi:SAM-dependent methyltransferase